MVEMAKANGVNVYHYLTYLLEKLPDDRMSDDELELLAPWNETDVYKRQDLAASVPGLFQTAFLSLLFLEKYTALPDHRSGHIHTQYIQHLSFFYV